MAKVITDSTGCFSGTSVTSRTLKPPTWNGMGSIALLRLLHHLLKHVNHAGEESFLLTAGGFVPRPAQRHGSEKEGIYLELKQMEERGKDDDTHDAEERMAWGSKCGSSQTRPDLKMAD